MNHDRITPSEATLLPASLGASGVDVAQAFDEFMRAFEAFKVVNDQRLAQIESRVSADPLTQDKLERINHALGEQKRMMDALVLKSRRPGLGGGEGVVSAEALERKAAFDAYVRSGDTSRLRDFETKDLTASTDRQGGYLVPDELSREISARMSDISPMRAICGVRQISRGSYKVPHSTTGMQTGWVGETGSRTKTDTPRLREAEYRTMELYAMPAATATLLDDAAIDVEAWIAGEVETVFAEQEGKAFINGGGNTRPKGLLRYNTVAQASWVPERLGFIASGKDGGFADAHPSDRLVDLIYSLKAGYRQNARWVMNRKTQAEIRKIKSSDGHYIWQPAAIAGGTPTLMNFPIAEAENMPDIARGSLSIAFGDFRRGYLIVDRMNVRVLRDPYSQKPFVLFYTTKRVGGGVADFDAIKLFKFAAG